MQYLFKTIVLIFFNDLKCEAVFIPDFFPDIFQLLLFLVQVTVLQKTKFG